MPTMSPHSDSASVASTSVSTSRDWYFPSPPFIHANSHSSKFPKYPRRFPTNPRPFQSQHLPPDYRQPLDGVSSPNSAPPSRGVSSSSSALRRSFNHERLRRRVDFGGRREQPRRNVDRQASWSASDGVSRRRSEVALGDKFIGSTRHGFRVRWKMVILAAIVTTVLSSVVYQNFCLHIKVNELQVFSCLINNVR
ncbi:hypothetical protein ACFX2I_022653 [Malus domestica]|uniref:Uncharacterized protein n=1 Tax=Malus domestica TaxID=3750 RepID=A0A498HN20_MALDO|nr:hypothetical protein DVH24_015429 [Malus domestica]